MVKQYIQYKEYPSKVFKTKEQLETEKIDAVYLQNITSYLREYFDKDFNLWILEIREEKDVYAILYKTDHQVNFRLINNEVSDILPEPARIITFFNTKAYAKRSMGEFKYKGKYTEYVSFFENKDGDILILELQPMLDNMYACLWNTNLKDWDFIKNKLNIK